MIAYLNGNITFKNPTYIHLDVNGIGYHVNISLNTYSHLESLDKTKIFTHVQVNAMDGQRTMYGFFDEAEKELFLLLISVSGVGASAARILLSYMTVQEVKSAILNEDVKSITKVKGIGPKTAKRLILDLKEKVFKLGGDAPVVAEVVQNNKIEDEASAALLALGFPKAAIDKQIKAITSSGEPVTQVEDLIKLVLKNMR